MMTYAPYDVHSNPASLKAFLNSAPSVVLNKTTNALVLLPFGNKELLEQAQLVFDDSLNIMLIDDKHYTALQGKWVLPKSGSRDIAINYFIQRCMELCSADTPTTILHQESYQHIYEILIEQDLDIIDIIKRIPKVVEKYGEASVNHMIFGQSLIPEKQATKDDINRAISEIDNTKVSGKHFELCYRINESSESEDVIILYSKVK